ncbi:MAG: 16S rRNA (cytosine(967)-C(5))-methyltransferase RsmB, partial [Thiobacillus sp.]|nr:16S rRNA (cytosine(967)-C(5))-methyltransferase RsmB [Thiobacillus sp.]
MRKLQQRAAGVLETVLAGTALHQILPQQLQQLDTPGERGALQDIVYGSLRQLGRLDAWLAALLERPLTDPQLGWLLHPDWWIDKLQVQYPASWQGILQASLLHPPFTLRVNRRHGDVAGTLQRLSEAGLPAHQTGPDAVTLDRAVAVHSLPGFAEGHVSVQDAGAQWAARLLDAQPGERVLDACAAPGGKSGHILERADVDLTALDVDAARLGRVQDNLERLRLTATVRAGDAAQPEAWWDGRLFDRILADVPCSASGVVRRNPDIKWLRRPGDIAQFAAQQAVMLDALWRLLA